MKQLLQYLRDYKRESILGPLFKLLEASFELFVPLVMAQIIDVGIKNRDLPYILGRGGVLVALGIIGMVCAITAQYFAAKAAVGCGTGLRRDLFAHLQGLSYADLDTLGTSTMITRMTSDINQVQNGVNMALRLFLRSPFIVFGAMVMAFTINIPAALVFVVAIPLLSLVVFGVMAATIPLYRRVQERLDRVLQLARENLTGVRVIRAFGQEERELADFTGANDRLVKAQLFVGKISAIMNPVTCVIINCAILALIWTGGWQVEGGVITQGEVVALIKPQFEAGKSDIGKNGIVKDKRVHLRVLQELHAFFQSCALYVHHIQKSSVVGRDGNQEYVVHLKSTPANKAMSYQSVITANEKG